MQENIIAIESPANTEAIAKPNEGNKVATLNAGRVAGIIVGSIVGLLIVIILVFVRKRNVNMSLRTRILGNPALTVKDTPFQHQGETLSANAPELDGGSNGKHEIDGHMFPGAELDARRDIQEMKSNEEVGSELAITALEISELPS